MKKKLSIIIPYYSESRKTLSELLSSINNQLGVDMDKIEVIMVNDCNSFGPLPKSFLMQFSNINSTQLRTKENVGPGMARQLGIDNSSGEYITFCDADDVLHNVLVLKSYLDAIAGGEDIIDFPWLEEYKTTSNKFEYRKNRSRDAIWLFGKLFRRAYLVDKAIRFNPKFRVHEDSNFLQIAYSLATSMKSVDEITYVWKWNPDSTVRRNNGLYEYEAFPVYISSTFDAFCKIKDHKSEVALTKAVLRFMAFVHCYINQEKFHGSNLKKYVKPILDTFSDEVTDFITYYNSASAEDIIAYAEEAKKNLNTASVLEPFDVWMKQFI